MKDKSSILKANVILKAIVYSSFYKFLTTTSN